MELKRSLDAAGTVCGGTGTAAAGPPGRAGLTGMAGLTETTGAQPCQAQPGTLPCSSCP